MKGTRYFIGGWFRNGSTSFRKIAEVKHLELCQF